ncbi:UDP-N-acetylglucosamine 2-epimerase [Mesorhizobium sp. A556]
MRAKRRVAYVTGTRADFGLMQSTLKLLQASEKMELVVVVTGMHLDPAYGFTVDEIERSGLPVAVRVEVEQGHPSGARTARNIGRMTMGFVDAFEQAQPDIVLLLGDRGEMLAGALAAIHLNIPIAHIHGGERSGTVDEPVRHAISKLSNFHFVATEESRDRLIRMGEQPDTVTVVGAPGLDGIREVANVDPAPLFSKYGLDPEKRLALFLFHPVPEESRQAKAATGSILDALAKEGVQVLALRPNSDGGSAEILAILEEHAARDTIRLVTHIPRNEYLSLLGSADMLIGNSSSGIIEAASFGTNVVNIGARQNLRQRNRNVIDAELVPDAITAALKLALARGRQAPINIYGDGQSGARIVSTLEQLALGNGAPRKINAY